ncbi:hypothetical protein KBC04_05715 [Candidatus Babeliales bacterium]|nr:hypothetical protein [Candidatus Babeliales bacterium]MBP9844218.1 hypothetical protein [Candidatus Babeliales bacterium]
MKEYLSLYRSKLDHYLSLNKEYKQISLSILDFVLFSDFRSREEDFLTHAVNCYNVSFIYHDFENKMLYIGRSDWELDEGAYCPPDEDFPNYVNETNSCKMSVNNYLEFRQSWIKTNKELPPFAIIYRDDKDWVHCQGFQSKEDMEQFIQDAQQIVN